MTTLPIGKRPAPALLGRVPRSGRHARRVEQTLAISGDVCCAVLVAAWNRPHLLLGVTVAMLVWGAKGLYSRRFSMSVLDDLGTLLIGGMLGLLTMLLLADTSRTALASMSIFVGAVILVRTLSYALMRRLRANGWIGYPVVVVGAGANGVALTERILAHPESGLRPVGFLDADPPEGLPVTSLGSPKDLPQVIREQHVTDVIVAYGKLPTAELVSVLRTCNRMGVEISVIPRFFEMHRLTPGHDHVWGLPLVPMHQHAASAWTWHVKRALDVVSALAALLFLWPVIAAAALAVRIDLGPGVLFRQERVGLDGQPITVLKLRSMRHVMPSSTASWAANDDPRLGRVGAFIRRFSIDELPQLLNVLRGDMSLVGPRPERPEYVHEFSRLYPRYGDRHRVPAGLTGLAAVEGLRGDTSIEDRAFFDNLYIENWSLWLDAKILVRTLLSVLRGTGA